MEEEQLTLVDGSLPLFRLAFEIFILYTLSFFSLSDEDFSGFLLLFGYFLLSQSTFTKKKGKRERNVEKEI